jgi:hypothetical protein
VKHSPALPLAALLACPFVQAQAPGPEALPDLRNPETYRRHLTLALIERLRDPVFRRMLGSRLGPQAHRILLADLVQDYARMGPDPARRTFLGWILDLDRALRRARGIEACTPSVLGLEVLWPRGASPGLDWDTVRFVVQPSRPKRQVVEVEAYDLQGRLEYLAADTPPPFPVIMAGEDRQITKRAGIRILNEGLARAGMAPREGRVGPEPIPCTRLSYISLQDNHEPWFKGASEIYAFVAGVDPTQDRPTLHRVDMPYLQWARTDYYPNQLVIFWNQFRFQAADLQLWEHDSNTDYQQILTSILGVLTRLVTAGAPVYAWIPALADGIVRAMPREWYLDTDDYVDTFYTLEEGRRYDRYPGAMANARVVLEPYVLWPRPVRRVDVM